MQPGQPINVEQELKATTKEHPLDQNDPKMQEKVAAYIQSVAADLPRETEKPAVPPSSDFDRSPLNLEMTEGLDDLKKVEVTDLEKAEFLKVLLADDPSLPVHLKVAAFGGQLTVQLRSRTVFEQKRIYNILDLNRLRGRFAVKAENGQETNVDLGAATLRFQQYSMALMVEAINGRPFSDLKFETPATDSAEHLSADAQRIDDFVDKNIAGMNQVRWNGLMNAMRLFEAKLAKLTTEANNGDFWLPRA